MISLTHICENCGLRLRSQGGCDIPKPVSQRRSAADEQFITRDNTGLFPWRAVALFLGVLLAKEFRLFRRGTPRLAGPHRQSEAAILEDPQAQEKGGRGPMVAPRVIWSCSVSPLITFL